MSEKRIYTQDVSLIKPDSTIFWKPDIEEYARVIEVIGKSGRGVDLKIERDNGNETSTMIIHSSDILGLYVNGEEYIWGRKEDYI